MASIKKREQDGAESYQVRYRDAEGKSRSKQFAKRKDAEAFRIKVESEVVAGVHTPESTSVTVAQAADLFLDGRKLRDLEPTSLRQYDAHIRLHIKPLLGADKLSKLTKPSVQLFGETMLKTGRSRAMAGKVLSTLRSIISDAHGRGLVAQNVALGTSLPVSGRRKKKIVVPTKPDLVAMLEAAEAGFPGFYPLLLTAVFTGLRTSELRGLRKDDFDLKARTVTVEQRADESGIIGPPKSKAGYRTVPVPAMLVPVLRAWFLKAPPSPLGLAFPNTDGGVRLHSNMLGREFYPVQIAAGVCDPTGKVDADGVPEMKARVNFHALRHAAASAWINQRVDLKRLMTWLGHSTVQMTLDTYGHLIVDDEADAAVAAATAAALFG
jgi:integrase